MQILRAKELNAFLNSRGRAHSLQNLKSEPLELMDLSSHFRMPESFGRVLVTIGIAVRLLEFDRWALLVVEDRGIWPNWEDLHAFYCLSIEAGLESDIAAGDAFKFEKEDSHRVFSFVQMMSNFRWGFRLICDRRNFHLAVTHDDDSTFYSSRMTQEISDGLQKAVQE